MLFFLAHFTVSNSTMFLMGPMKQLKRMCDKTRALATTLMLVSAKNKNKKINPQKTEHVTQT